MGVLLSKSISNKSKIETEQLDMESIWSPLKLYSQLKCCLDVMTLYMTSKSLKTMLSFPG